MSSYRAVLFALSALAAASAIAQTTPALTTALPSGSLVSLGTTISIDLSKHFAIPGVTGQVVQFDTALGKFNVEMLASAAPINVANFLNYVQSSSYTNSFFHRSATFNNTTIAIIQGGGYTWAGSSYNTIEAFNPVPLEYNLPNARGTLAAARTSDINSATSQWYFNVADNSTTLGTANGGGYTVFGRVIGTGMTVVDAFAALPRVNAGGAFTELPVRNYTPGAPFTTANMSMVNSVTLVPVYPNGNGGSVLTFTSGNSNTISLDAQVVGSALNLTPLGSGLATVTVRGTDSNGNQVEGTMNLTMLPPLSRQVAAGQSAAFTALTGATAYQWQRNGVDLVGSTTLGLNVANVQPASAGLYSAKMTTSTGTQNTRSAILGVNSTVKVLGNGSEIAGNILHPNGNIFDQILLDGAAVSATADAGQAIRISYIDLTDDIVQIEFSGPGTITIVLDSSTPPAPPVKYTQPSVSYVRGRASIIISGATAATNLGVFSVGRATAFDPTGTYNILQGPSATNNPANNGSPLFVGQSSTVYDGMADLGFVAIHSATGEFGGLRAANTRFSASTGLTGVYAPDVAFSGPVFVGDIDATGTATPCLSIGGGSDVRITGGDLKQTNGQAVQVTGISQLKFTPGSSSTGVVTPTQTNQARLEQAGTDITSQIVVYQ